MISRLSLYFPRLFGNIRRVFWITLVFGLWGFPSLFAETLVNSYESGKFQISLYQSDDKNEVEFRAKNGEFEDVLLSLDLQITNLEANTALPLEMSLRGRYKNGILNEADEVSLLKLTRKDIKKAFSYKFQWKIFFGNPEADHNGVYAFPAPLKQKFRIDNAFFGEGAHAKLQPHSVDIAMEEGTPVHAAREGIVIRTKSDGEIGGPDMSFAKHGNYVLILHPDGTYANYVHFQKDGIKVETGQIVQTGEILGLSGNTGYSTGPHLHFDVSKADGKGGLETIPWKFMIGGTEILPKKGMVLSRED